MQKRIKLLLMAGIITAISLSFVMGRLLKRYVILLKLGTDSFAYKCGMKEIVGVLISTMLLLIVVFCMLLCIIRLYYRLFSFENREEIIMGRLQEIKCSTAQLQENYIAHEKIYKAKSRFMSRMSHDLRTPLNAIMGYAILIDKSVEDIDRVRRFSRKIFVAGQTLLELVNETLDIGCVESGKIKLIEREFSISSALEEVRTAIQPQVDAKMQKFHFSMKNDSGKDLVIGDKQRFCQVLRNILSNAVKYTGEGGCIDLKVNIEPEENDMIYITYQVRDTGCGMSEEFKEKIFQPFQREDREMNDGVQGAGLGMCISKCLVELMGGIISIASKQGCGTLVTVKIPLRAINKPETSSYGTFVEGNELNGIHFLAAEDNEFNAEILKEVLTVMGAECTLVDNGQKAVNDFVNSETGTYDAVLMDVQMPVMDGYRATKAIRNSDHPDAEKIIIIAMTADAFEEDVQKAFEYGMNAHVAKPMNIKALIQIIKILGLK